MTRPSYLIRMENELEELNQKIRKIEAFIYHGAVFPTLPILEQVQLSAQLGHMRAYSSALHARIVDKNIELREE